MVGSPRPRLPSPHRPRPTPTWPGLLQPGSRHPRLAVRLHHPPGLDPDLGGYRPGTPPPPVRPGRARPRARAVPAAELLAFLDADHPLWDKTLWWLAVRDRRPRQGEVLASTSPIWDLAAPARRGRRQGAAEPRSLAGRPSLPAAAPTPAPPGQPGDLRQAHLRRGSPPQPARSTPTDDADQHHMPVPHGVTGALPPPICPALQVGGVTTLASGV